MASLPPDHFSRLTFMTTGNRATMLTRCTPSRPPSSSPRTRTTAAAAPTPFPGYTSFFSPAPPLEHSHRRRHQRQKEQVPTTRSSRSIQGNVPKCSPCYRTKKAAADTPTSAIPSSSVHSPLGEKGSLPPAPPRPYRQNLYDIVHFPHTTPPMLSPP